ncbi:hypothetical protein QQZ08_003075 [Neonectria magnoliae]|uniref:Uncharacterized protein n=1 Tax=Neonectria magnoliae TaxID=2732573 RepID=A0ABR1IBN1_9HYPO
MGGKVWSGEEERAFWEIVIPQSCVAAQAPAQPLDWGQCAELMRDIMGPDARRDYSYTSMYEHHYQSINFGPKSHVAKKLLEKHQRQVEWYKNNSAPCPATPPGQEDANNEENEGLLDIILAKDPGAKAFLRNKSLNQARGRSREIQPTPAGFGGYAVNGGAGNQLNPAGTSLPDGPPPAARTRPSNLRPLVPKGPVRTEPEPQHQYQYGQTSSASNGPVVSNSVPHNGYYNTVRDMSNIDPALMVGAEMNHSVSRNQSGYHHTGQDMSNIDPALMGGVEMSHSASSSQHGYHRIEQDMSNIDPALLPSDSVTHSAPAPDIMPGLSRTISSTSSAAGSASSEDTATKRYRPLAPARAPGAALGVGGALSHEAQQAQAQLDRAVGKRQFGFDHNGPESPPKRPTLEMHHEGYEGYEGYQTYEPQPRSQPQQQPQAESQQPPQQLTHWQRMGFRDERKREFVTYTNTNHNNQYQKIRVRYDPEIHGSVENPSQHAGIPPYESPDVRRVARQFSEPRYRPLAPAPPRTQDSGNELQSDQRPGQYRRLRPRPRKAPEFNHLI